MYVTLELGDLQSTQLAKCTLLNGWALDFCLKDPSLMQTGALAAAPVFRLTLTGSSILDEMKGQDSSWNSHAAVEWLIAYLPVASLLFSEKQYCVVMPVISAGGMFKTCSIVT